MQIEQRRARRFNNIMQRPRVSPIVEFGRQVQGIKGRGDIGDDPEDQPHGRPGLTDDHGDILARQTQGDHADEVDHPIDDESSFPVRVRVVAHGRVRSVGVRERDLERERDQAVGERHEEVGDDGAAPADDDEDVEFDRRVLASSGRWGDEFCVDGEEEGEAEEGKDDEVDQADRHCWRGNRGCEWSEAEHGEADGWGESLRCGLEVGDGDGGVLQYRARPHLAEHGGHFGLQSTELWQDVVVIRVLVPRFHPNLLACAERVIAGIALLNRLLEHSSRVWVDDDSGPCLEIVDCLTNLHWVVIEYCRIDCNIA